MTTTAAVKVKNGIGIARVSSEEQKKHYGLETQSGEIENRSRELEINLLEVWEYQESATKADKRPQFETYLHRLVTMGQAGEVDVVIFPRPDRLGRDGEAAFFYYIHLLEQTGQLQVRFARDDVDPGDPFRNFKLFMEAFKAKRDADTIRTNTMEGRRRRGKEGKIPAGHVAWPFDYDFKYVAGNKATGKPRLNKERAAWVRRWVKWLLEEKVSLYEVCRRMDAAGVLPPGAHEAVTRLIHKDGLNYDEALERYLSARRSYPTWQVTTVRRMLCHPSLRGEFYAFKNDKTPLLIHKDDSLALLTDEEAEAINAIIAENRELTPRNTKRYYTPLKGFVWCHCGRRAIGWYREGKTPYFRCEPCRAIDGCTPHKTNALSLWEAVREIFTSILTNPESISPVLSECLKSRENREELEARKGGIEAELEDLDGAFERVIRMFAILEGYGEEKLRGEVENIKQRRARLEAELKEVEQSLKADYQVEIGNARLKEVCQKMASVLDKATDDEWRGLFREFGLKVVLRPGQDHLLKVAVDAVPSPSVMMHATRGAQHKTTITWRVKEAETLRDAV